MQDEVSPQTSDSADAVNQDATIQSPAIANEQNVIQPSEKLEPAVQLPQEAAQSVVVAPQDSQPAPRQPTDSEITPPQSAKAPAAPSADDEIPAGMSASQLGVDTAGKNTFNRGSLIKKAVVIAVILVVLGAGFIFVRVFLSGLGTKTLTNGNTSYTFKFYRTAALVHLNNRASAYKYGNNEIAEAQPTTDNEPYSCAQIGSKWHQAFTVRVYNEERPVCSADDIGYVMYFTANGSKHLFSVTYRTPQTTDAYPALQAIFSSVKVSA